MIAGVVHINIPPPLFGDRAVEEIKGKALQRLEEFDRILFQFWHEPRVFANDSLSRTLADWAARFKTATTAPTFSGETKRAYLAELKTLLLDSVGTEDWRPLLDEDPLLGSDGFVYGKRHLALNLSYFPERRRRSSVLNPAEPLILESHKPARYLAAWLQAEMGAREWRKAHRVVDKRYDRRFRNFAPFTPFLPMKEQPGQIRFQLRRECDQMKEQVLHGQGDALSQALVQWIESLDRWIQERRSDDLLQPIQELKGLLANLGDNPYLSDGRVYGEMQLALLVSEQGWEHLAEEHVLSRYLIHWLASRGFSVEEPSEVRRRYQELESSGELRLLPTAQREQIAEHQREQHARAVDEAEEFDRDQAAVIASYRGVEERMNELERADERRLEEEHRFVLDTIARLEARLQELELVPARLHQNIQEVRILIDEVRASTRETRAVLQQKQQQGEDAKRESSDAWMGAVLSIALSWGSYQLGLNTVFKF